MNLLLLEPQDFINKHQVVLSGRRLKHVLEVHQAAVGDQLRVGQLNGKIGSGTITQLTDDKLEMDVELTEEPPEALPLTVLLALPRPKMLKRSLQHLTALGQKPLFL